ncbi:syntaxin-binding protein 3-like [Salvelinus alpinus]|uniref:syntaxin-binding protein 3-like n=1 Tax=Salvelinus alpinus TaxID=8036 RepID=UPI0039FC9D97
MYGHCGDDIVVDALINEAGIKETVIEDCKKSEIWKILILDHFTTKLLSTCCKMSDLTQQGIAVSVEDLYKSIEPLLEMKAIYFMTPTGKFVDAFIGDFKLKPKYKAAYVYFTDYCSDELFSKMKQYRAKYIRVCKEINISFLPQESQVSFLNTMLDNTTLDNAKQLAALVDNKLAQHYEMEDNDKKKGKTHAQLLILESGFDPVTPILHELTYQAMAYENNTYKNNTYKYKCKDGSEKEALLNENDELWVRLRHMHIAEVSEQIPKLVKEISANKKQPDGKITISVLSQLMKKMPHFRKQVAQKTVHLNLTEDCMNHFQKNVQKLCKAEQDLAVGSGVEGQKVKDPMRTLLPVLLHPHVIYDKIRAVLLYIFSLNGTTEENLNKLIQHVKIQEDREFILNWKRTGSPHHIFPSLFPLLRSSRKERFQEETYNLSRWTPVIKDLMEVNVMQTMITLINRFFVSQNRTVSLFSGTGREGVTRAGARQKHKASSQDERRSGSRLIIFVIGGISYSEMRCAYQVTQSVKSCEVLIGSSHIVTSIKLLDDIQALSKPTTTKESFTIVKE